MCALPGLETLPREPNDFSHTHAHLGLNALLQEFQRHKEPFLLFMMTLPSQESAEISLESSLPTQPAGLAPLLVGGTLVRPLMPPVSDQETQEFHPCEAENPGLFTRWDSSVTWLAKQRSRHHRPNSYPCRPHTPAWPPSRQSSAVSCAGHFRQPLLVGFLVAGRGDDLASRGCHGFAELTAA